MSPSGARNSTQLLVRTTTRVSAFTGTGAGTLGAAVTSGVGVDAGVDPTAGTGVEATVPRAVASCGSGVAGGAARGGSGANGWAACACPIDGIDMTTGGGGAGTATTAGGAAAGAASWRVAGHVLAGNAPPEVLRTSWLCVGRVGIGVGTAT